MSLMSFNGMSSSLESPGEKVLSALLFLAVLAAGFFLPFSEVCESSSSDSTPESDFLVAVFFCLAPLALFVPYFGPGFLFLGVSLSPSVASFSESEDSLSSVVF